MTNKELDGALKLNDLLFESGLPYLISSVTCQVNKKFCSCSFFGKLTDFSEWREFLKYNSNFTHWNFSPMDINFPWIVSFYVEFNLQDKKMIIETGPEGQWIISTIVDGHLMSKQFFGYSKKEAVKLFNQYIKNEREELKK
jgi:hypothetical protein